MNNHFGIKAICFATNLTYKLYIVLCGFIVLIGIAMAFNVIGNDFQLRVQLPMPVKYLVSGSLEINNTVVELNYEEAHGKIHIVDTPKFMVWIFWISMSIAALFGYFILYVIRKFIKSVREGLIFESRNIFLLQKVSYLLIGLWFYAIIYDRIFYYTIAKYITFDNLLISDSFSYYPAIIISAASLWLLVYIVNEGIKISEENKLTI